MKVLVAMLGLAVVAGSALLPAAAQSPAATPAAPAAGDSSPAMGSASAPASAASAGPTAADGGVVSQGLAPASATSAGAPKVEATIEQIENLISAPPEARIGREIDEGKNREVLFGDPKRIAQLLGEDPRFVYIPAGGDPMIVPWIRERVMALEILDEAKSLYKQRQLQAALQKVKTVIESYSGTDAAKEARELSQKIEKELATDVAGGNNTPIPKPEDQGLPLPPWIQNNTRGVAFNETSPTDSIVLVGDFALRPGETVPSFPGITIKEVAKGTVTYDYQGSLHKVQVEGR